MSLEKKYNSIDQSKLKPAVRDILKKMKEKSENFTNSDINKKVEPALDKLLMRLEKELPEAIKKATKTPSKPKAKPKAKAKAKPKTKSTKETFTQKASKLMKKEGISWAEAKNKLSKQLKDEKDKVEKDIKSDNKQALNELDKLIKSTEFKKDLGKFPKKSSGEERELTSDISADGKRQALPRGKRKSKNGKTIFVAGYYILKYTGMGWQHAFCPKLETLDKYENRGPYFTEWDMNLNLNKAKKE